MIKTFFQDVMTVTVKESIQLLRDKLTVGMMVGIPFMQLILFGYAINLDPKNLETALVIDDHTPYVYSLLDRIKGTGYFEFTTTTRPEDAINLLKTGEVQFVIQIPPRFTRDVIRGNKPNVLVQFDATDSSNSNKALLALNTLGQYQQQLEHTGALAYLGQEQTAFNFLEQAYFNPLGKTEYNIVPGLLGVVLTMTLVVVTSLALTRERERGTIESLLATPLTATHITLGKIIPFIVIGYVQACLILFVAHVLFHIPYIGSVTLLLVMAMPFIAANLSLGLLFSATATNQLQAVQGSFFFFLPSILLSGFLFPFDGMPEWAQVIGNILPLTHFLIITRSILLKGATFMDLYVQFFAILAFALVMLGLGIKKFRRTLD